MHRLLGVWGEYILHVGGTRIEVFMRADCGGLYIVEKYLLSPSPFHKRKALSDVSDDGFGHVSCFGQKNGEFHVLSGDLKRTHFSAFFSCA